MKSIKTTRKWLLLMPLLLTIQEALAQDIAVVDEDRMLEPDLRLLLQRIRNQAWTLYE